MERSHKPESYIKSPLVVLRGLAALALLGVRKVDDALAEFDDARPYTPENYPPILNVEAPVATEAELDLD